MPHTSPEAVKPVRACLTRLAQLTRESAGSAAPLGEPGRAELGIASRPIARDRSVVAGGPPAKDAGVRIARSSSNLFKWLPMVRMARLSNYFLPRSETSPQLWAPTGKRSQCQRLTSKNNVAHGIRPPCTPKMLLTLVATEPFALSTSGANRRRIVSVPPGQRRDALGLGKSHCSIPQGGICWLA